MYKAEGSDIQRIRKHAMKTLQALEEDYREMKKLIDRIDAALANLKVYEK
jgi:hypothetical protein